MDEEQKINPASSVSASQVSDTKVPETPTATEQTDLDKIAAMCKDYENSWKRALADYQNLKKEVSKEREEMASFAVVRVIERFMPALDYFKQALAHKPDPTQLDAWFVGIGHIEKQFEDALADLGLKKIATIGEKFDATKHEAVGEEEAEGKEHGTIIKEVMPGYEINGKVVRPSRVITAK